MVGHCYRYQKCSRWGSCTAIVEITHRPEEAVISQMSQSGSKLSPGSGHYGSTQFGSILLWIYHDSIRLSVVSTV